MDYRLIKAADAHQVHTDNPVLTIKVQGHEHFLGFLHQEAECLVHLTWGRESGSGLQVVSYLFFDCQRLIHRLYLFELDSAWLTGCFLLAE